jgi:hypothetical protein
LTDILEYLLIDISLVFSKEGLVIKFKSIAARTGTYLLCNDRDAFLLSTIFEHCRKDWKPFPNIRFNLVPTYFGHVH